MTTFFSVTYGPEAEDVYYYGDKEAALHAIKTLSQGRAWTILSEYTLASNKQYEEADIHWVWDQAKDKVVSIKFDDL
jgi:hypothetical protein